MLSKNGRALCLAHPGMATSMSGILSRSMQPVLVSWLWQVVKVIFTRSEFVVRMRELAEWLDTNTSYLAGKHQDPQDVLRLLK